MRESKKIEYVNVKDARVTWERNKDGGPLLATIWWWFQHGVSRTEVYSDERQLQFHWMAYEQGSTP